MRQKTNSLVMGAFFCALTAVASQLIIPTQPVPFSFAMVAIYLSGVLLNRGTAFWTQVAYVLLGAAGAPVFSGFSGGLGKLFGPTGGYLAAYPLMAYVIALLAEKWGRGFWKYAASMSLALVLCYLLGAAWLAISSGVSFWTALAIGMLPMIPLDLVKVFGAAFFANGLRRALARAGLLPASAIPKGQPSRKDYKNSSGNF